MRAGLCTQLQRCDVEVKNFVSKTIPSSEPHYISQLLLAFFPFLGSQTNIEMAPPTNRQDILEKLWGQIANGQAIVGAGAGIGLSAKFVEQGGGDLIIIYNSGRFRMAGRGSLAGLMPYGNANDVVLEMVILGCQYIKLPLTVGQANQTLGERGTANREAHTGYCWRLRH